MNVTITARHFEATEDLKTYIEDHLADTEKFLDKIMNATVVLAVEKYRNKAEMTVETTVKNFHCEAITDDMYRSVDDCLEKLKKQLRRYKEKIKNHKYENPEKAVPTGDGGTDYSEATDD